VDALNELLVTAVAGRAAVRVRIPIELDDKAEANPDIALVRRPWQGYPAAHPRPVDIFLLVSMAVRARILAPANTWITDDNLSRRHSALRGRPPISRIAPSRQALTPSVPEA
jgi:hypothetical protein